MNKLDNKTYIFLAFLLLTLIIVSVIFIGNVDINNAENCKYYINSINLKDLKYQIIYEEISVFPEIKNIRCLGTFVRYENVIDSEFVSVDNLENNNRDVLDKFEIVNEYLVIYVYKSSLVEKITTVLISLFSLICIYFNKNLIFLSNCFLIILMNQIFFEFSFETTLNILFIYLLIFLDNTFKINKFSIDKKSKLIWISVNYSVYFLIFYFFLLSSSFSNLNYLIPLILLFSNKYTYSSNQSPDLRILFITYSILFIIPVVEYSKLIETSIFIVLIAIYFIVVYLIYAFEKFKASEINILNQLISFFTLCYLLNLLFKEFNSNSIILFSSTLIIYLRTVNKELISKTLNFLTVLVLVFSLSLSVPEMFNNFKISNFFDSDEQVVEESNAGINIVHILFDGLPNSVANSIYENSKSDLIYFKNVFTTAYSTEKALLDMFNGKSWDGIENYNSYKSNSINSKSDLISHLKNENFDTFLYTDKGGVVHNVNALKFNKTYLNNGNESNKDVLENFYGENNQISESIFENIADLSFQEYLIGYWRDVLKLKEFNIVNFFSKTPILGFDNLARAYGDYRNFDGMLTYQFIHLIFPHEPYSVTSDCKFTNVYFETPDESWKCTEKLINIIAEKFSNDNTLLIIHGDHGPLFYLESPKDLLDKETYDSFIKNRLHIGLLVKGPDTIRSVNNDVDTILIINKIIKNFIQSKEVSILGPTSMVYKIPIEDRIFEFDLSYMLDVIKD